MARRYLALDPSPSSGAGEGRRGPGFHSKPPLNLHVAALRDPRTLPEVLGDPHNALALLHAWANFTRRERGQELPRRCTLAAETQYLLANLDYITRQPWITELVAQLRVVQAQLRAATGEPNPRPVSYCIAPIKDEHGTFIDWCNHPLFPPREGEMNIRCSGCAATYDPMEQIKLRIANEQDPAAGDPCAACDHASSQHDNDASGARPCLVRWCECKAHRKIAAA